MKRLALVVFGLSACGGLGWKGYTWSQHRSAAQETSLPDLTTTPVNADAANWANGEKRGATGEGRYSSSQADVATGRAGDGAPQRTASTVVGAASGDRPPADPFLGITQTAGTLSTPTISGGDGANSGAAATRPNPRDRYGDARYMGTEPQPLNADPGAQPIAPEPAVPNRNNSADYRTTAADYRTNPNDTPAASPEQNPADFSTRQTSGIAEPTGKVEPSSRVDSTAKSELSMDDRLNPSPSAAAKADPRIRIMARHQIGNRLRRSIRARLAMPDLLSAPVNNGISQNQFDNPNSTGPNSMGQGGLPATTNGLRQPGAMATPPGFAVTSPASDNATALLARSNAGMSNAGLGGGIAPEGFGKPGDKKLEGAQTPSVTIEKIAPQEIQVGKPAKFQIVVRNTGPVPAEDVEVTDPVPQGTQLLSTNPKTTTGPRGEILWKAGDLKPGENSKLEVELMPIAEGEIGSTASVQFRSAASMRMVATKPELSLDVSAPKQVLIGQNVTVHIKLTNPGTGAASQVVLSARIPANLQHQAGNELEFEVGQFKPGDNREMDLTLHAAQAGPCSVTLSASSDANLHTEQIANIEVVAPRLEVKLAGPTLRYLDKQAKYTVSVSNPGTAPAKDITLVTRLPKGMQFVDASDSGRYDSVMNAVLWGLDELPAGQSGSVTLTALAKEAGDQKLRSEIKAAGGLTDANEQVTMVEGVAAVAFTVTSIDDPVEVGGKATYEIHVVNQGSKAANHLQLMAVLPEGMKPLSGEGPAKQVIDGQKVVFEPLARLEPKRDFTYKVVGQCFTPGDMRVQVLLQTDEMTKPVVKEEGTKVYKD